MNSGFCDFLTQLPSGLIVTFCLFGTILIVALALIFRERLGLGAGKPAAQGQGLWSSLTSAVNPSDNPVEHELPDLDLLLDTSTLAASKPAAVGRSGSVYQVRLSNGHEVEAVEVMTLLRDLGDGRLIVHIGEKAYRSGERVSDPEFIRRLTSAMPELEMLVANMEAASEPEPQTAAPPEIETPVMIEQGPMEEPQPETFAPPEVVEAANPFVPSAPPAEPEESSAAAESPPSEAADELPAPTPVASEKPKPAKKGSELPGDLPKFESNTPLKPRKNLFERMPKPEPIPELDIAGAIETFLQYKLQNTPEYAERSIHVHPSPTGGVMIEVDGVYYESVGDVADQQVRDFLSKTVQEWQDRQ